MKTIWKCTQKPTCVVICGGRGTRLGVTNNKTKSLIKLNDKPILGHIIDYWRQFTNDFVFIFDNSSRKIESYVKTLPINSKCILENDSKGVANALFYAKDHVSENFILTLGDTVCKGHFSFKNSLEQGVGTWKTNNISYIKRSYSIVSKGDNIQKVVEKPDELENDLCGMGFYFFNKKVFDYIKKTKPSKKTGKVEITEVIQEMINSGENVSSVPFYGDYINITYKEDLENAKELLK